MKVKVRNLSSGSQPEVTMVANADKEYEGALNFLEPGEYVAEAVYNAEGKTLGKAQQQFQVEEYSLEDQALTMNRQLLSQMAEVSGGKFYTISDFENLPKDLVLQERRVEKQKSWEIWNQPVILIFALAFLSLEWFLRKRHQLP